MSRIAKGWRTTGKSTWEKFCKENPSIKLSYVDFQNIVYGFNEGFRDYLLETGDKVKLSYGWGDFAIQKKKSKTFKKHRITGNYVTALNVDWKKTKELGFKVYHFNSHTEGFQFSLKWWNKTARFPFSETWSFKPYRTTSRMIKHYINKHSESQFKYKEWNEII
jgi:hypothetical protein